MEYYERLAKKKVMTNGLYLNIYQQLKFRGIVVSSSKCVMRINSVKKSSFLRDEWCDWNKTPKSHKQRSFESAI